MNNKLLIIDDSSIIRNSIKRIFKDDYEIVFAKDGVEGIETLESERDFVGIFLDIDMPNIDGFGVLDYLTENKIIEEIPVVIISSDESKETRRRVFEYDVTDMIEKPFNVIAIRRRMNRLVNLYLKNTDLEEKIAEQRKEIKAIDLKQAEKLENILVSFANNIMESDSSVLLQKRVKMFAEKMMEMYPKYNIDENLIDKIVTTCPLYNVGAITIKHNTIITSKAVDEIIDNGLTISKLVIEDKQEYKVCENIIKYSCELYDGSGFPNNAKGDEIPIEAQIVSVLVRLHKYTKEKSFATSVRMILEKCNKKYNKDILNVLREIRRELKNIE